MYFLDLLLLLTAFGTPLAVEYPTPTSSSECPSLQPVVTTTITHTLDDILSLTSTFYSTTAILTTTTEYQARHQGSQAITTTVISTPFIITKTALEIVTVTIPQFQTKVAPVDVTATIVHISTTTVTTQLDFVITKTSMVHKLAHQDLYQSSPIVITSVKVIPTCTSEVTVSVSRPRGVTSTVDILVISTATTTLYTTSDITTTTTVTLHRCGGSESVKKASDEL